MHLTAMGTQVLVAPAILVHQDPAPAGGVVVAGFPGRVLVVSRAATEPDLMAPGPKPPLQLQSVGERPAIQRATRLRHQRV